MAADVTELQVFVASPGDVQKERNRLETVIKALNNDLGTAGKLRLRLVQWKTHTHPDLGEDAQDVINRWLGNLGPSDIFIGSIPQPRLSGIPPGQEAPAYSCMRG